MALHSNELGELFNPEDHEPPKNPFAKYADLHPVMHGYDVVPRRKLPARKCDICDREYEPAATHQRYCSTECRKEAKRNRERERVRKVECPERHKVFETKVNNKKYCSDECRNAARRVHRKALRAAGLAVLIALLPSIAFANAHDTDEPLEVMDIPIKIEGGKMAHGTGAAIVSVRAQDGAEDTIAYDVDNVPETVQETPSWEPETAQIGYSQTTDGYYGYVAEYNELYNTDGPSHEMPGWHDGYLETYYSDTVMRHYMSDQWTVDSEGFYRDGDYYIVGVDINDTNPNTGEPYQIGDVVDTGKGQALVMDYGSGARVHDFYVHGW